MKMYGHELFPLLKQISYLNSFWPYTLYRMAKFLFVFVLSLSYPPTDRSYLRTSNIRRQALHISIRLISRPCKNMALLTAFILIVPFLFLNLQNMHCYAMTVDPRFAMSRGVDESVC